MLRILSSLLLISGVLSAQVDWRFAHPSADMLMGFNLKSLVTSPAGAPLREALGGFGGMNGDRLRMLEDVEEIYVSVRSKYVKGRPSGEPMGVILLRGNFDSGDMMKLLAGQAKVVAQLVDRRTIMLGDEESMRGAALRLKGEDALESPVIGRAKELAAANDFWMVGSPAPVYAMKPRGSMKNQGMLSEIENIFDNLRSFSMGVSFRDELSIDLGLNLRSKAAADQLMSLYRRFEGDMQKTPAGQKSWAEMAKALEIHPNGSSVRIQMRGSMENLQAAFKQGLPLSVVAEQRPPAPVILPSPTPAPVPVRRTVRVYGMESGYREFPASPSASPR